ncbi:ABC-type transport system protein (macronuclear) [Tetrahymena thermophila SB210]|uniref:ABC-type transport system protein n=1 Tax=Tetrahymena thermophila (strain SB210) TaxID=312017 RepID=Q22D54_TETTS|nr:ABC-type transport system protein [Tetrahymena thermophila SB210]EAR83199.2 ABC-type transport system protein [Tetrahymena thermophila SB210]|eukprot:XP_001030862.2 ABC-type transport system protein [Tetrahymena thermophila SB210]
MSKIISEIQNQIVEEKTSSSMDICYNNLSYSIVQKQKERIILNNISGKFSKGLNAILGGSGAGKTSLLNILSKKISSEKQKIQGKITLNGVEYDNQMFQKFACYVMQEDILLPTLTVREYLEFAANLKLKHLSQQDRLQQVTKIIKLLMLQKCENTLIGDHLNKGISGGEKKRVCIGIELLRNPKVLFLDEPTSGLDSFTAYMIIKMLKDFAYQENRTIIFTIHQPSSDIWELFDQVTLLVEGKFIYNGPRKETVDYFTIKGFSCPKYSNPADYLMNLMQSRDYDIYKKLWIQEENKQEDNSIHLSILQKRDQQNNYNSQKQNNIKDFFYALKILTKRQLLNLKRNRILLKARFFQSLFMNVFLGLIYLDQSSKTSTPQDILQICKSILLIGLGSFFSSMNPQTLAFSSERAVFLKEENSKMYTTLNYYISKTLPEIFVCSWFGLQVSLICYFMYGFGGDASNFFFFALNFMLINNIGSSIGVLSCCLFEQASIAVSFSITFMMPQVLFSGIYKNVNDLPAYVSWCKYLTPTFYSTNAIVNDQFEGKNIPFNPVEQLHYDFNKWLSILILILLYLGINLISFLLLQYRRRALQ